MVVACTAGPAWSQLVSVKTLSLDMTLTLLNTAAKCAKSDKVTVAIVDRNQVLLASFRGPLATVNTMDIARRKAATAAQFGRASGDLAGRGPGAPANPAANPEIARLNQLLTMSSAGELILGGALPIKLGDETIAAIGVSGVGPMEEACAKEAIAAIQNQLK